jgi:hypothetical protein
MSGVNPEDEPVPLGDERLDEMLAGGLRPGELCGLYANLEVGLGGVRRVLARIVRHCTTGGSAPVLYFALTPAAGEARRQIPGHLGPRAGEAVLAPPVRSYTVESLEDRAGSFAERHPFRLIVVDPLDAVAPDDGHGEGWEHEAQVVRSLKALARSVQTPVLTTCTEWVYPAARPPQRPARSSTQRSLPTDPLVAAADVLIQTNGRYAEMVKNRHGMTRLHW